MQQYKYFLLFILIILFGSSVYSMDSADFQWNRLRWTKDVDMAVQKFPYRFNVPADGEIYTFECTNSPEVGLLDVNVDGRSVPVCDKLQFVAEWGVIKVKANRVSVFLLPMRNSDCQCIKVTVTSGKLSTSFEFYSQLAIS